MKKLKNIIIVWLMTNYRSNILTTTDWQMFEKELKMWFTDPVTEETLIKLDLHVSTLSYLEERPHCFIELLYNIMVM